MSPSIRTITLKYLIGVNCYLIQTNTGYILIDTGFATRRAQLEQSLAEVGCEPGKLALIVLTHGDADHVGNAAYLREKYGAKIALHSADWGMVEKGDMSWNRGLNALQKGVFKVLGRIMPIETFTPDRTLKDGDTLSEYGLDARIIHLPGHSKGNCGLLTAAGDLFCGDLLSSMPRPDLHITVDQAAAQASVEKLKKLPIQTVYPGHGKPFSMAAFSQHQS